MPRPRCLFSFYGAKSKIAGRYPPPMHDLIIEPFAGGASYSLRYCDRQVLLNEANPVVFSIWDYVLNTPVEQVLAEVPRQVEKGDLATDMVSDGTHPGLLALLRANVNMGTMGARGTMNQVTWFAATNWYQVHNRLEYWLPKIQHWVVRLGDYRAVENRKATWFIDPPYDNDAGARYSVSSVDYAHLADWAKSRDGQVIVCENEGALWLPFEPIGKAHSRGGVNQGVEAVCVLSNA